MPPKDREDETMKIEEEGLSNISLFLELSFSVYENPSSPWKTLLGIFYCWDDSLLSMVKHTQIHIHTHKHTNDLEYLNSLHIIALTYN